MAQEKRFHIEPCPVGKSPVAHDYDIAHQPHIKCHFHIHRFVVRARQLDVPILIRRKSRRIHAQIVAARGQGIRSEPVRVGRCLLSILPLLIVSDIHLRAFYRGSGDIGNFDIDPANGRVHRCLRRKG